MKIAAVKVPSAFDAASLFRKVTSEGGPWRQEKLVFAAKSERERDSKKKSAPSLIGEFESPKSEPEPAPVTSTLDCRPHPFRLQIGAKTALLIIAYPPFFLNSDLDRLMQALVHLDSVHGDELHPRFFDWEKQVWISARRWKGSCRSN